MDYKQTILFLTTLAIVLLFGAFSSAKGGTNDMVAARYGITLQAGETLVAVNGVPVTDAGPLVHIINSRPIRSTVDRAQDWFPILDRQQVRATRQCVRDASGNWNCGSQ